MLSAVENDIGHAGQGFHVVENRGLSPEAPLDGTDVLGPGFAHMSLNGGHEGCGFAADEGAASADHLQLKPFPGAHHIVAQNSRRLRIADGLADVTDRDDIFVTDIQESLFGADGEGADSHALQHAVGVAVHDGTVHKCAGIALVAVAGHVLGKVVISCCGAPFDGGGEAGAAAAPETRIIHLAKNLLRRHGEGLLQRLVAAGGDILVKACGINVSGVPQGNLHLGGIKGIFLKRAGFCAVRIFVEEAFHHFILQDGGGEDLIHVGRLYMKISRTGGENGYDRPVFTEAFAAGLFDGTFYFCRSAGFGELLPEFLRQKKTAVCGTSGAAAYADGFHSPPPFR